MNHSGTTKSNTDNKSLEEELLEKDTGYDPFTPTSKDNPRPPGDPPSRNSRFDTEKE